MRCNEKCRRILLFLPFPFKDFTHLWVPGISVDAAYRLFTGVEKLHVHFMRSVMAVWRKAIEGMCHMFQQRLAAYRMLQVLELSCARSICSAMQTLKEFVSRHRPYLETFCLHQVVLRASARVRAVFSLHGSNVVVCSNSVVALCIN